MHGGRPKHEEPHVKKIKKRTYEKTEYILRVDLESLGINEDDFEDLQSLFEVDILRMMKPDTYNSLMFYSQLYDRDRDGILTVKELQMLLRCLGLKPDIDQEQNFSYFNSYTSWRHLQFICIVPI